jgi:predicted PurR-regulated permease PerM
MNRRIAAVVVILSMVMVVMLVGATALLSSLPTQIQSTNAFVVTGEIEQRKAPTAIRGDNVYVAWWDNKTGNNEVFFRASTDKGQTFGDKINLSNTPNASSTRAEIDSDANSVVVTWWETNQTSDTPVMKISTDNGKTFGPLLKLSANGTIGSGGGG